MAVHDIRPRFDGIRPRITLRLHLAYTHRLTTPVKSVFRLSDVGEHPVSSWSKHHDNLPNLYETEHLIITD